MNACQGVHDWLECLRCDLICSASCPLEGDDAVQNLAVELRRAQALREELRGVGSTV